jgi:hypothetical protein
MRRTCGDAGGQVRCSCLARAYSFSDSRVLGRALRLRGESILPLQVTVTTRSAQSTFSQPAFDMTPHESPLEQT